MLVDSVFVTLQSPEYGKLVVYLQQFTAALASAQEVARA